MIYLVDFENTGSIGLDGLEDIEENDKVIIFYSEKSHTVDIEIIEAFKKCKGEVNLFKIKKSAPNYADFHIATITGAYIQKGEMVSIISNDKGYVSVIDYWKEDLYFGRPVTVQLTDRMCKVKDAVRERDKLPEDIYIENTNLIKEPKIEEGKTKTAVSSALNKAKKSEKKEEDNSDTEEKEEMHSPSTTELPKDLKEEITEDDSKKAENFSLEKLQEMLNKNKTADTLRFDLINQFGRLKGSQIFEVYKDYYVPAKKRGRKAKK